MSHPSLTPAEAERLLLLAAAASNIAITCDLILRDGYDSPWNIVPDQDGDPVTSCDGRQALMTDIGDLIAVRRLMYKSGDIVASVVSCNADEAFKEFRSFTEHQTYEPEVRADEH